MGIKEHRSYTHLPFQLVLGRSQVDLKGRRTDLGYASNSVKRIDIEDLPSPDRISHEDFLPHSVIKSTKKAAQGHSLAYLPAKRPTPIKITPPEKPLITLHAMSKLSIESALFTIADKDKLDGDISVEYPSMAKHETAESSFMRSEANITL